VLSDIKLRIAALPEGLFLPRSRRHVLAYDKGGSACAYGAVDGNDRWVLVPDVAAFRLRCGSRSVDALPQPGVPASDVLDAWYGMVLPLAVQSVLDHEVIHASAVMLEGLGVLAFCGPSGSGKSTVAYGLGCRGCALWADDAVAFAAGDVVTSLALPFTLNLRSPAAEQLGYEVGSPSRPAVRDGLEGRREPLRAVFVLEAGSANGTCAAAEIAPLPSGRALHALLPNAYRFRPESRPRRRATIRSYLELVARVPILGLS